MTTLKIEERIVIQAPVDAVWKFLLDPERVVQCLPGAAYDGKESEQVFLGHIKVKVGPVTTWFAGKATMSEVDEASHSLRITGEGKDKNGAGTAKMVMVGKVTAVDGGTELAVDADVDIAGKLVTFGRGLIKAVSAQLFKQFAVRAQEMLTEVMVTPAVEASVGAETEVTVSMHPAAAPHGPAAVADADQKSALAPPSSATGTAATKGAPLTKRAQPRDESLNALTLVFRAIAASIAKAFRRWFGRKG
jgi:uncharacterized protein